MHRLFLRSSLVLAYLAAGAVPSAAQPEPNGLSGEQSPYLLKHAHDPVDWRPWGAEAFELARRDNKPIFLSSGFSTCHWCHVMARESFQDPETAAFLNQHFVCIKVDRDERPDVDQIYMAFVQATTGRGGWPLCVWLTPDREPLAGGTYFPPEDRPGRPGFRTVLRQIVDAWTADREQLLAAARETTTALRSLALVPQPTAPASEVVFRDRAFTAVAAEFDPRHGGFGGPPKFPKPCTLAFLFDVHAATPDSDAGRQALRMALKTLRAMEAGGIHDQLGGGFHRYAVDVAWRQPHFEKLLPDQAQLAIAYLTAYQLTGDETFAASARSTLDAVLRDLTDSGGGFHAAIDADSPRAGEADESTEGAFYRWTRSQIEAVLGQDRASLFCFHCGPDAAGPATGSVLYERHNLAKTAAAFAVSSDEAAAELSACRGLLLAARDQRPGPRVDDTLITSGNGLMISAFARGHQLLGEAAYLDAANAAADRLQSDLVHPDGGGLFHARRGEGPPSGGFTEDYAFLIQGLLDLYESSFDSGRLAWAVDLQDRQDALFWDAAEGGYFATPADDPLLLIRIKPDRDETVPSVNAVAVANLVRLATILDQPHRRTKAEQILEAFRGRLERTPTAAVQLLTESDRLTAPPMHVVIAGKRAAEDTAALLRVVWRCHSRNRVVLLADGDERLAELSPLVRPIPAADSRPATAYICRGELCHPPTTDPETVFKLLASPTDRVN